MGTSNVKSEEGTLEKENVPVPAFSESKEQVVLQPGTNCKGILQSSLSCGNEEDVQVNIIGSGCIISGGKPVEDACEDDTDTECSSSSSFGDTGSGVEDALGSAFTDTEVESPMCDDWSKTAVRKNKTTTVHWRRFVHPIRWRLPISDGNRRNKVMKRKKRNKAEERDLSSYMSSHSIFSYYENKNHSHDACLEDFHGDALRGNADNIEELKFNSIWSSVEHEDNDKAVNDIIQKIEDLQSQVQKLKARIDNVVSENPGKFCSVTQLSMIGPSDGFNHSGHNSASFAGNENTLPVSFVHPSSQNTSELNTEDLLLTENTLSTREGIAPFIETTNRPHLEVLQENIKDEILVQNQAANEELHDFENVRNQFVEKAKESVEEQKSISAIQVSESDMDTENAVSTLKASTSKSNIRRNTKRGRKKSGAKRWRRR
ncbi:uncharacterized protein LOC113862925 isoform X2 [Abrus precatorius]|uniref:Uncharacterized protein LOC113862925 isoform X2 n=1 Tax=Abrus precatorius TaxID=3816 RepID=A0A8B8L6U6_ABRPR|nr:uncharacterized protein LOC113862925 isoform X2 [Abrus precatorius]